MTICKKMKIGEHECLSGNFKGLDFDVFVVKEPYCNMIMMYTYSGTMVNNYQNQEYQLSKVKDLTFKCA